MPPLTGNESERRRREEQRVVGTHEVDQAAALAEHGDLAGRCSSRTGSPVWTSADLICATVHDGCRCIRSATAPDTCGAAMLVPDIAPNGPAWFTGSDEVIATPGAATSGFSWSDTGVGPPEEKSAIVPRERRRRDRDRRGRVRRRADRAVAVLVELVVGCDHRHDAGRAPPRRSPCTTKSRCGEISGSPSERLITFIPSATAASIAAAICAELPSRPKPGVGIVSAL